MSKVSVRQAAWLSGKSRETINTATKRGVLSFTMNGRNQKEIDVAELERVYPLVRSMNELPAQSDEVSDRPEPDGGPSDLRQEVAVLRERVQGLSNERDFLKTERERERRQLEEEIEHLRDSLKAAQDNHGKAMLLLTHTRAPEAGAGGATPDKLATLEQGVQILQKQNRAIARELRRQKQGLWRRLFGGGEPPVVSEKKTRP
jgi:hypothetical protein